MDIKKFIRPHLLNINTYEAVDAPELLAEKAGILKEDIIKLNGNENPFGPSPKVISAAMALGDDVIWPDQYLRSKLS